MRSLHRQMQSFRVPAREVSPSPPSPPPLSLSRNRAISNLADNPYLSLDIRQTYIVSRSGSFVRRHEHLAERSAISGRAGRPALRYFAAAL